MIGTRDAPSFLAVLMEWVVTSYLRAFDTPKQRAMAQP
jgi:hypothetical protein